MCCLNEVPDPNVNKYWRSSSVQMSYFVEVFGDVRINSVRRIRTRDGAVKCILVHINSPQPPLIQRIYSGKFKYSEGPNSQTLSVVVVI